MADHTGISHYVDAADATTTQGPIMASSSAIDENTKGRNRLEGPAPTKVVTAWVEQATQLPPSAAL